ncbi:MAG: hypothetical protein ABR961_00250 [Thermoanaerobaculaceae bacterium]
MTWAFGFLACFVVGLVLAVVSGLIRDLQSLARHKVVVPHSAKQLPFLNLLGRRLAGGLILSGVVGLILVAQRSIGPRVALLWAVAAGILGVVAASVPLHRPCSTAWSSEYATVVKDIQPGGYGQVKLQRNGIAVLLAAQSAEPLVIPAGSNVEVVDCTRSVITVRLPSRQ